MTKKVEPIKATPTTKIIDGKPVNVVYRPKAGVRLAPSSSIKLVDARPSTSAIRTTPERAPRLAGPWSGAAWLLLQGAIYFWTHFKVVRK